MGFLNIFKKSDSHNSDDKELDRFITIQKMIDKGVSKDDIERLKKYIWYTKKAPTKNSKTCSTFISPIYL